mmetsp:Transcript_12922/g.24274  ORF Transcript_12922/g.24274 Transcript_12922/m.24274 type:complete len:393 (-) Transcript_12922:24-1202(-)
MDVIEKLLNERIPLADDESHGDDDKDQRHTPGEGRQPQHQFLTSSSSIIEDQPSRYTLMECCQTTGIGVSWLNHLLFDDHREGGEDKASSSQSSNSSDVVLSENAKCILKNILQQHNLLDIKWESRDVSAGSHTPLDWSFLTNSTKSETATTSTSDDVVAAHQRMQRKIGHSTLFYSLLSILKKCAMEALDHPKESVSSPLSSSLGVAATNSNSSSHFTGMTTILQRCARQMEKRPNILCAKDVPINFDSIQTIQAALIFLSSKVPDCSRRLYEDYFPRMPLLESNPKELDSGTIDTAAFQLVSGIDLGNVDFVDKLMRLESFFFTSTDADYVARIRMVPRSEKEGTAARMEEEEYLKKLQVSSKKMTKSKKKVAPTESKNEKITAKRIKTS